jgi:hypothetical protein
MRKDEDRENAVCLTSASLIKFCLRADAAMGAYTAIVKVVAAYLKHKDAVGMICLVLEPMYRRCSRGNNNALLSLAPSRLASFEH